MAAIQRFTTNMGKRLGLKVSGRYREVGAIRRWPHLEVRLYMPCNDSIFTLLLIKVSMSHVMRGLYTKVKH